MADIGDRRLVEGVSPELRPKAMETIRGLVEDAIDAMKLSNEDTDVILVGGGSIILRRTLAGAAEVVKPQHFGCANAIGSAISKISGNYEKLINYDVVPRELALAQARRRRLSWR